MQPRQVRYKPVLLAAMLCREINAADESQIYSGIRSRNTLHEQTCELGVATSSGRRVKGEFHVRDGAIAGIRESPKQRASDEASRHKCEPIGLLRA